MSCFDMWVYYLINFSMFIYIDGQRFKVRSDGQVKGKTVYTVLGIDIEGNKEILGLCG